MKKNEDVKKSTQLRKLNILPRVFICKLAHTPCALQRGGKCEIDKFEDFIERAKRLSGGGRMTTFEFVDANLRECLINLANARVKPNVTEKEIASLKEKIEHWNELKNLVVMHGCKTATEQQGR